jgi:hypothetical protein
MKIDSNLEEDIYKKVGKEIQENFFKDGLLIKAKADSAGNEKNMESLYIKYRADSLIKEHKNSVAFKKKEERLNKINNASLIFFVIFGLVFLFLFMAIIFIILFNLPS